MVATIKPFTRKCMSDWCVLHAACEVFNKDGTSVGIYCRDHAVGLANELDDQEVITMMQNTSIAALFKPQQKALPANSPGVYVNSTQV